MINTSHSDKNQRNKEWHFILNNLREKDSFGDFGLERMERQQYFAAGQCLNMLLELQPDSSDYRKKSKQFFRKMYSLGIPWGDVLGYNNTLVKCVNMNHLKLWSDILYEIQGSGLLNTVSRFLGHPTLKGYEFDSQIRDQIDGSLIEAASRQKRPFLDFAFQNLQSTVDGFSIAEIVGQYDGVMGLQWCLSCRKPLTMKTGVIGSTLYLKVESDYCESIIRESTDHATIQFLWDHRQELDAGTQKFMVCMLAFFHHHEILREAMKFYESTVILQLINETRLTMDTYMKLAELNSGHEVAHISAVEAVIAAVEWTKLREEVSMVVAEPRRSKRRM